MNCLRFLGAGVINYIRSGIKTGMAMAVVMILAIKNLMNTANG